MSKVRWPRLVMAALAVIASGALIFAFISSRRPPGAVPGSAPILSLVALDSGFIAGTNKGVFISKDGKTWTRPKGLEQKRSLVARAADAAVISVDGTLLETTDLRTFSPAFGIVQKAIAIAGDSEGNIYIAEDADSLVLIKPDDSLQRVTAIDGPREVIALGGISGDPVVILAGGLTSGYWRSLGGDAPWRQILKTPTRAILVDRAKQDRILLGTAGGIFYSNDEGFKFEFTEMRSAVEALAENKGIYYAMTDERVIHFSRDGVKKWSPLVE